MGGQKGSGIGILVLFFLCLSADFPPCFSAANQPQTNTNQKSFLNQIGSSAVFPLKGNVYPLGYYSVSVKIGNPPKVFELDIDTGSDLTWVQCDAPCTGCTKPRDQLYKPKNNILLCSDPICASVPKPRNHPCKAPKDQCDYEIGYADDGSSLGVIVVDNFPLQLTNGTRLGPRLAFGCGYDQSHPGPNAPPPTAGVLGLGNGKSSILSQLSQQGLARNVVGHCLSGKGGFLFFGDDFVPSKGITWTPMTSSSGNHYSSGPAALYFGGKAAGAKGLNFVFDSGSSYTYFNSLAYGAVVDLLKKDLNGKLKEVKDPSLPLCWKGSKPFKSVQDVKSYFKPLALSFKKGWGSSQLQFPPEAHLVITVHGNACLGILNGHEVGLGDLNVLGDISLEHQMVIYDNEEQRIGWIPANCDRIPKSGNT
ncbi:hypothetical protein UlMin_035856 [Ulmus minor]